CCCPHLKELYLNLCLHRHIECGTVKLPEQVLTSKSLESLVLRGRMFLMVKLVYGGNGCPYLPSLKNLELDLDY
ncbi:hypothetical protein HN51_026988, partial [Arachis hypogaea]